MTGRQVESREMKGMFAKSAPASEPTPLRMKMKPLVRIRQQGRGSKHVHRGEGCAGFEAADEDE